MTPRCDGWSAESDDNNYAIASSVHSTIREVLRAIHMVHRSLDRLLVNFLVSRLLASLANESPNTHFLRPRFAPTLTS